MSIRNLLYAAVERNMLPDTSTVEAIHDTGDGLEIIFFDDCGDIRCWAYDGDVMDLILEVDKLDG